VFEGKPSFVSHTMPATRGFDFLTSILQRGTIQPKPHSKKFGMSIEGCYPIVDNTAPIHGKVKGLSSFYVHLIFDFEDIKPYVQPAFYLPLTNYTWFHFKGCSITWLRLTWETELCGMKPLPIRLVKAILVHPRRKALISKLQDQGFNIQTTLQRTKLQFEMLKYNKETLRSEDLNLAWKITHKYNQAVASLFNIAYEPKTLIKQILEAETQRLGETCRICQSFKIKRGLLTEPLKPICTLTGKQTLLDDTCPNWRIDQNSFILNLQK